VLASGGTSNDDSASAVKVVEDVGGTGATPWSVALRPKRSAMSHVGNGAVNGSRMRTTSQMAENFESMTVGRPLLQDQYQTTRAAPSEDFPAFG
jgi:hypothetical protein